MKWSIEKKLTGGFGLAFAIVIVIIAISYKNMLNLIETERMVVHTYEVLTELETTLSTLKDAETGQRGYIITGEDSYLEPYYTAISQIDARFKRLKDLTADNANQQGRLSYLEPRIADRLNLLREGIELRREKGIETAWHLILSDHGKELMDEIRKILAEMESEEKELLNRRGEESKRSTRNSILLLSALTLLSLFMLFLIYLIINRYIKERRRAEAALQESEGRLQSILDNTTSVIYLKDAEGRYILVNRRFETLFHITKEQVRGKTDYDLFSKEMSDIYRKNDLKVLETGEVLELEEIGLHDDGMHTYISIKFPLCHTEGAPYGLCGVSTDITERKLIEEKIRGLNESLEKRSIQLEAANKELEAFSYSVSHDLRSPLRAIDGFSRLLVEDYSNHLDDEGKRFLDIIRTNSKQMAQLIDDLLSFSRLGRKELGNTGIDMTKLVKSVVDELSKTESDCNAVIEVHNLPPASGDSALIKQVFVNLISNALKFTKNRSNPTIEIGSMVEQHTGATRNGDIYYIKDNGVGFDEQYSNKLFGVFQRLHSKEEFEGTGVGLAIVQRVIHRHGGRVWAKAKVNEGATFYFTLPKQGEENEYK